MSGASDAVVLAHCIKLDHTPITINGRDFRKLCENPDQLHPGLIVIHSAAMTNQNRFIKTALARTDRQALADTPQDWMVNRVVEEDLQGAATHAQLPGDHALQAQTSNGNRHSLPPPLHSSPKVSLPSKPS